MPGIKNRFFQVHWKFILISFLTAAIVFIMTAATLSTFNSRKYEPKRMILFFCEVDNVVISKQNAAKLSDMVDTFFLRYDDAFSPTDESKQYNLSMFPSLGGFENPSEKLLLLTLDASGSIINSLRYEHVFLENGAVITASSIESLIWKGVKNNG